eukprot:TRINITY_DN1619_c0_g1_i2.p1 TRINITY_DN1619_c0_g1~~TRINITY_DN1619_c0_g1_i2.p1  ORF type:complete len:446 (+),score=78.21 TRINITY_DN1619_c0_g1_i2:683-2020(+)
MAYYAISKGVYVKMAVIRAEPALGDQIMKCDHWEGNQIVKDAPILEGAPNFRRIPGTILFGVGQPSYDGFHSIKQVLASGSHQAYSSESLNNDISSMKDEGLHSGKLSSSAGLSNDTLFTKSSQDEDPFTRLIWINLREEPVLYINGMPFAPRDKETLNVNLDHLIGIEGMDLEMMEQRLKADLIQKAKQESNHIEVVVQNSSMENVKETLEYSSRTIFTPKEVFGKINDFIPVQYARVPITDECAPQERDFEELVFLLKDLVLLTNSTITDTKAAVVFNCQMGRGRTTTGIVCAYLIMYIHTTHTDEILYDWKNTREKSLKSGIRASQAPNYINGEYSVILQLVGLLPDGPFIKYQVDRAIDACSQVQNLREAIVECRDIWLKGGPNSQKFLDRGLNYLERYWWLIVFNAYLSEQSPLGFKQAFPDWMKGRWGFKRLLKKLTLH